MAGMAKISDKRMLDFLDGLEASPAAGWILRESTTGRGYRLHMTTRREMDGIGVSAPLHGSAREAIAHFMRSVGEAK